MADDVRQALRFSHRAPEGPVDRFDPLVLCVNNG
jgi:hypothetical protein